MVRTVHHVDDFDTEKLMDCQRQAISEPDHVLVVSRMWQQILVADYGVHPGLVGNGVDTEQVSSADPGLARRLRQRWHRPGRWCCPWRHRAAQGHRHAGRALARLRQAAPGLSMRAAAVARPVPRRHRRALVQDHRWYREQVLAALPGLGLAAGRDVVELGTVPDEEIPAWYQAADVLAFPSVKEGFGLAPLEAMAAGTPVVVSDLPVFGEWLRAGRDALQVPVGDDAALADALGRVLADQELAARLRAAGQLVASRHSWAAEAERHERLYERFVRLPALSGRRAPVIPSAGPSRWPWPGCRPGYATSAAGRCGSGASRQAPARAAGR